MYWNIHFQVIHPVSNNLHIWNICPGTKTIVVLPFINFIPTVYPGSIFLFDDKVEFGEQVS